jgi:hypothetical protein
VACSIWILQDLKWLLARLRRRLGWVWSALRWLWHGLRRRHELRLHGRRLLVMGWVHARRRKRRLDLLWRPSTSHLSLNFLQTHHLATGARFGSADATIRPSCRGLGL